MAEQQEPTPTQLNMASNRKGYTLLELLIALAVMGLLLGIAFPSFFAFRDRVLLQNTALELESALGVARRLSTDENREYAVELFATRFSVRQNRFGSPRVISSDYPPGIVRGPGCDNRVIYYRDGQTQYGKFVLENRRKQRIKVEVHVNTGRVTISEIY